MLWLLEKVWVYRSEILLAIQVLAKLRKTAQEIARDYIRRKIETKLKHAIAAVGGQILLFVFLAQVTVDFPGWTTQALASLALWVVTLFNLGQLCLVTVPELASLHRTMRGKTGYALKYFLEVSLVTELLRLNVLFLAICLAAGISSRTVLGGRFSYLRPWQQLLVPAPHRHLRPSGGH